MVLTRMQKAEGQSESIRILPARLVAANAPSDEHRPQTEPHQQRGESGTAAAVPVAGSTSADCGTTLGSAEVKPAGRAEEKRPETLTVAGPAACAGRRP
jgi:hypothetical protein